MLYCLFPHDALDSCHTWTVTLWITYNKVARTFFRRLYVYAYHHWKYDVMGFSRYHVVVMSCDLESFNVGISLSYVNIIVDEKYLIFKWLNFRPRVWYLSTGLHAVYLHCIFSLIRAHWEHFTRDGYTSCALGKWIHSITLCALGTLRVCWVHFMCVGYIDIWQWFVRAGFIDTRALDLLIHDIGDLLYLSCILFLRCWYICYDYDIQWIQGIYLYICLNFHLCFCVYDFCRSLWTLW